MQSKDQKFDEHRVVSDPAAVRRIALQILTAADRSPATLDALLEETGPLNRLSDARDRALCNTLIFGVLRWRARLDFLIAAFSRTPLKKIKPEVLNILRIGIYQIVFLNRIPNSAAVNTAVELTKSAAPGWVVRYVNAVLRRVSAEHGKVTLPALEDDPVTAISVQQSFPRWLVRRWIDRLGAEQARLLCESVNRIAPLTVRTNTLRSDRSALLEVLASEAESVQPTVAAPEGIALRRPRRPVADMPAFQQGRFQVQDEAAQLVTWMLNPRPGERILDACAGLGGKTGHIAQLMENRGTILATDRSSAKLLRLQEQMQRMGVTIVESRALDLLQSAAVAQLGRFDRILVDAPCSGLGVLRRNPDAKWKSREKDLEHYGRGQLRLLESLGGLVSEGGQMVYAVCSSEPEEGEAVIGSFLARHPEFNLDEPASWMPPPAAELLEGAYLRTSPVRYDMDGFFAASLSR